MRDVPLSPQSSHSSFLEGVERPLVMLLLLPDRSGALLLTEGGGAVNGRPSASALIFSRYICSTSRPEVLERIYHKLVVARPSANDSELPGTKGQTQPQGAVPTIRTQP